MRSYLNGLKNVYTACLFKNRKFQYNAGNTDCILKCSNKFGKFETFRAPSRRDTVCPHCSAPHRTDAKLLHISAQFYKFNTFISKTKRCCDKIEQ